MANVRFYRLPALPVWNATEYKGIFVHIEDSQGNGEFNPFAKGNGSIETKNGYKVWKYGSTKSNNETIGLYWINDERGASEEIRDFETNDGTIKGRFTYMGGGYVCTGLWFGGTNGWELLTNDTDVNYINQLIDSKINALDVNTFQTVEHTSSTTTGVTGEVFTFKGVKEDNGIVAQGNGTDTFIVGDGSLIISGKGATSAGNIPAAETTGVFSANDTASSTIILGDEFVWDGTNKNLGLRVKTPVSASNNIVTQSDIATLAGAMHYVGAIQKVSTTTPANGDYYTAIVGSTPYYLSTTTQGTATEKTAVAGDTLIVSGTENITPFETGDMFVYSDATHTNVVQTNMTLGVSNGQVAKNDGDLSANKIVIATANGIQTTTYTVGIYSNASSREQSLTDDNVEGNGTTGDANIIHGTTETDSIIILGKTNSKTLKIASSNASIDIRKKTNSNSEIDIDLVWNTVLN